VHTAQLTLPIILTLKATVQHSSPCTAYIQMHCKTRYVFWLFCSSRCLSCLCGCARTVVLSANNIVCDSNVDS